MSEYDYQNPVFIDITHEFLSTTLREGQVIELAPNFGLEDAVSSVDVLLWPPSLGLT